MAEKCGREHEGDVQYLTDVQLDSIIKQNPENDIRDHEDLQAGTVPGLVYLKCSMTRPEILTNHTDTSTIE